MTVATPIAIGSRVVRWLSEHEIDYELIEHQATTSARQRASALGVALRCIAHTRVLETGDGRRSLVVVGGCHGLDLGKAARALDARTVRAVPEGQLRRILSHTVAGQALAPLPGLYRLPLIADYVVRDDPILCFPAERLDATVRVKRSAWESAVGPVYADLAAGVGIRSALCPEVEPAVWLHGEGRDPRHALEGFFPPHARRHRGAIGHN